MVVGLVKYVHPLVGFVASAVLGVVRILKELEGGSNGMHAYYEHQREVIVEEIKAMRGMNKVAEVWLERLQADNPTNDPKIAYDNWHQALDVRNVKDSTITRMDRLFALSYQLNEWGGAMRPVSMPAFANLKWDTDDASVRHSLAQQHFHPRAVDLVLKLKV